MWTSKRSVLLLLGFALFFTGYGVYAHYLGGIDGLPQLPPEFWPDAVPPIKSQVLPRPRHSVDEKLQQAFGPDSDVLKRTIKLEVQTRGMVLAADDFSIDDAGRVRLKPFRVALFGRSIGESGTPEINTVSSDTAILTFDSPIKSLTDIGSRRVVAGDLQGNVTIVNNRRTPNRDDDLSLTTPGPVHYDESRNLIWTDKVVRLLDPQSQPKPTQISATGMDVYLIKDKKRSATAGPPRKARTDSVTGVEKIGLRGGVEMHLYVDSHSGFLAARKTDRPEPVGPQPSGQGSPGAGPQPPPQKSHVRITTEGPFVYDMIKDRARFDVSPRPSAFRVNVIREPEPESADQPGKRDQLDCDHLELQFSRKNAAKQTGTSKKDEHQGLTIESAHATANAGQEVILVSDAEMLEAHGNELFYDARTRTSTLCGDQEIWAVKEGHELHARELQLVQQEGFQQVTALGPGRIDMLDKKTGRRPLHASWQDKLVSSKDGAFDVLVLMGSAAFEDQDHDQQLRGDYLKVWLKPAEHKPGTDSSQDRLQPHHVEATGHVTADSAEMHVRAPTDHLVIWFKDLPAKTAATPAPSGAAAKRPPGDLSVSGRPAGQEVPAAVGTRAPAGGATASETTGKSKKPIDLSAGSIEAHVLQGENKNELERLWCEGHVVVHQEPASPKEKGVDIHGETLQLTHYPEGHLLVVTGNLALVQLDKISILGPEVTIDQKTNVARVNGMGIMKMPSSADFHGGQLAQPSELTIRWKKDMFFNGKHAWFQGDIQANQGTGGLLCQNMQVILDRPVSFKEGEKEGQAAKVERLVCDKKVYLEDKTLDQGRVVGRQQLQAPEVDFDNEYGLVNASGPGIVHILRWGPVGETVFGPTQSTGAKSRQASNPRKKPGPAAPAAPKQGQEAKEELKHTQIHFLQRLSGDNNKRIARFYGNVEVIQAPADPNALRDHANLYLDKDHPPPGWMYMRSHQLKVFTRVLPDNQRSQDLQAEGNVIVRADNWFATAAVVKYDEEQDRVIFEGREGSPAVLYRRHRKGDPYDKVTGQKILYWRRTNDCRIEIGGEMRLTE